MRVGVLQRTGAVAHREQRLDDSDRVPAIERRGSSKAMPQAERRLMVASQDGALRQRFESLGEATREHAALTVCPALEFLSAAAQVKAIEKGARIRRFQPLPIPLKQRDLEVGQVARNGERVEPEFCGSQHDIWPELLSYDEHNLLERIAGGRVVTLRPEERTRLLPGNASGAVCGYNGDERQAAPLSDGTCQRRPIMQYGEPAEHLDPQSQVF